MTPSRQELLDLYALPDRSTTRVRMNFVESADGAVTLRGRSGTLGGETDRDVMSVLRTLSDVVVVGAGTIRVEGYGGVALPPDDVAWRRENGLADQPHVAVVSNHLSLDPDAPLFAEAARRPIVVTRADAPADRLRELEAVADLIVCGEASVNLTMMLERFEHRGLTQVLCEGGPRLFGALLDADLVDQVCLTIAPRFVGGDAGRIDAGAAERDRRFRLAGSFVDDDGFVFLRYAK